MNIFRLGDFVDCLYLIDLQIKGSTDTARPTSYIDPHLKIDSEGRNFATKEITITNMQVTITNI